MGSKMVSVRVPVGLLAEIDRQRGALSRSGFLVRAAEGACGLGGEPAGVVEAVSPLVERAPAADKGARLLFARRVKTSAEARAGVGPIKRPGEK